MSKHDIRGRYYLALAEGYSQDDAVRIANGGQPEDQAQEQQEPADEYPTDAEMREAIKAAAGKAPGPRTSRAKLIEQYKAL